MAVGARLRGGRADVADDAVAEAFARTIARDGDVREPIGYLYRIAFRVAAAELSERGDRRELADHTGRESEPADDEVDLWSALIALPPRPAGGPLPLLPSRPPCA
jgi:DNA-directed RNA polymerase specialized sigma24 family protein